MQFAALGDIQGIIADMEAAIVRELEAKERAQCSNCSTRFSSQVLECAETIRVLGAKAFEIDR